MTPNTSKPNMPAANAQTESAHSQLHRRRLEALVAAESTLHCIEVLGCIFSTVSALSHREARLALWSLSALLTSALSLFLLHRRRQLYLRTGVREWLYAGMRLHRAFAIVGMRRVLKKPVLLPSSAAPLAPADRVYFAKALLVNSSILPIMLQSMVLRLPLPLQAAVQVAVAAVILRSTPAYCESLAADGVQPSQFRWLASAQSQLASLVMAATSSSRGSLRPSEVPCSLSMAHLVLVFEVITPILFVYFCDCAAPYWYGGGSSSSRDGRVAGSGAAASSSRDGSRAGSSGGSSGGNSGGAASRDERPAAAAAAGAGAAAAASTPGSSSGAQRGSSGSGSSGGSTGVLARHGCPSAHLVMLFGLGLSGVLFDVMCTMHSRMAIF